MPLFFLFSFLGWLLETSHFVIRWGKLTDRGFLCLPLCPVYGFAVCLSGLLLGSPRRGLLRSAFARTKKLRAPLRLTADAGLFSLYYLFAAALPAGAELCVGGVCDKLLGIKLWDYSYKADNLFGYITVGRTLLWGLLIALVLALLWEPLRESLCAPAAARRAGAAAAVLCALTVIDFAFNLTYLFVFGEHLLLFAPVYL